MVVALVLHLHEALLSNNFEQNNWINFNSFGKIIIHFFTFLGGAGLALRFGVSCSDVDIFDGAGDPFTTFVIVVDDDFRTADEGRDGGRSFFCILAESFTKIKTEN